MTEEDFKVEWKKNFFICCLIINKPQPNLHSMGHLYLRALVASL